MPFDPDNYTATPVAPQPVVSAPAAAPSQEPTAGNFDPDAYLSTPPDTTTTNTKPKTMQDQLMGGLQVAKDTVSEYGRPALEIGGGLLGAKKTFEAINAYKQGTNAKLYGDLITNYSKLNHDIRQYEKMNGGRGVAPQELLDARARLVPQMQQAQSRLPGYNSNITAATQPAVPVEPTGVPATPTGAPAPQPQPGAFSGLAQRFAPIMNRVAPVLRGASNLVAPAMLARELFYTSPEEQIALKQMEDQKRLQGWRPINETAAQSQDRLDQLIKLRAAQQALKPTGQ